MKSKVWRGLSLMLALLMVVCLFSACGKDTGDSSDEIEIEYEYVDENGNPIDPDTLGGGNTDEGDDDKTASTDNKTETTSSGKSGASNNKNNNKNNKTEVVKGKTKFDADPYGDIPASVKGSTVDVLLWRTPEKTDLSMKDAFEKKTGIKVNYIYTANNTAAYQTKLATLISAGDSPDVVSMGSGTFPSYAIASLEPLDEEVFRLEDPIWNKTYMDAYKINGKYYCLSIAGSWYSDDVNYVTYYNPETLKSVGITTTPYQLWKAGKWNTTEVEKIIRKVSSMGDKYTGLSIQTNTVPNPYMLSAGVDYVKYDGKNFTSNLSNTTVLETNRMLAQWYADGLVTGWDSAGLGAGTIGLFDAIAYGMYKDANWFSIPTSKFEVVPIAGTHTPSNPKVWGVPKGAQNVQGAAYFLRFFLDPESFNETSFGSFKATFATEQMHEVWQAMNKASTPKAVNYTRGMLEFYDTSAYNAFATKISSTAPAQVNTVLGEYGRTMDAACNRSNTNLKKAQKSPSYK